MSPTLYALANVGSDREFAQRDLFEYRAGQLSTVAVPRPGDTIVLPVWTGPGGKGDYNKQSAQLAPIKNSAPILPARIIEAYDGKPQMAIKSVPRGPFAAVDSEQRVADKTGLLSGI